MNVETDTTSSLGDHGAGLEGLVYAFNRVVLDLDQEARRELRARGSGVEESRRSVREELLAHVVVGLDGSGDVVLVDADSDPGRRQFKCEVSETWPEDKIRKSDKPTS